MITTMGKKNLRSCTLALKAPIWNGHVMSFPLMFHGQGRSHGHAYHQKREGSTQKNSWRNWKQSMTHVAGYMLGSEYSLCAKLHTDRKELAGAAFFCRSWCRLCARSGGTWYLFCEAAARRPQRSPWWAKSPRKESRLRTMITLIWRW